MLYAVCAFKIVFLFMIGYWSEHRLYTLPNKQTWKPYVFSIFIVHLASYDEFMNNFIRLRTNNAPERVAVACLVSILNSFGWVKDRELPAPHSIHKSQTHTTIWIWIPFVDIYIQNRTHYTIRIHTLQEINWWYSIEHGFEDIIFVLYVVCTHYTIHIPMQHIECRYR